MAFVVSVVQNKGGCGKTTFATSLYATAVYRGESAGIIDLDPQGNATTWCLGRAGFVNVPQHTGAEQICSPGGTLTPARFTGNHLPEAVAAAAVPCARMAGGYLFPANPYMDRSRMQTIHMEHVPFATVLVDTPPQMPSTLLRSIVAQSDAVVVPVHPEPWGVQNIAGLLSEIEHAGGGEMLDAGRVRLVFNMTQKCLTHAAWQTYVAEHWGGLLSPVVVPRAAAWGDMANFGVAWNPKSKPSRTALELWADIHNHASTKVAA